LFATLAADHYVNWRDPPGQGDSSARPRVTIATVPRDPAAGSTVNILNGVIDVDRFFVPAECPNCEYPIEVQIRDVRLEARVFCPNCKSAIHLVDHESGTEVGLRKAERALQDLAQQLRKLGG
jgi:hypothetical protein